MNIPDNTHDVIDSRDVIARIDDLENDEELDDEGRAELATLRDLAEQGEGFADWEYGETLIQDSYFREYAQELAEDMGAIARDVGWPAYCIDWDQAARDLQIDYSAVDFGGVTYWIHN